MNISTYLERKVLQSVGNTRQALVPASSLDDDADRRGRLTKVDTRNLDAGSLTHRG